MKNDSFTAVTELVLVFLALRIFSIRKCYYYRVKIQEVFWG